MHERWHVNFSYSCKVLPLLYLSKVEGQFRVRLGLEMVSHHLVKVEVHRTRVGENGYVSHMPLCICGIWFLIELGLTQRCCWVLKWHIGVIQPFNFKSRVKILNFTNLIFCSHMPLWHYYFLFKIFCFTLDWVWEVLDKVYEGFPIL